LLLAAGQEERESANMAKCKSNMHQLGIATLTCAEQNRGVLPSFFGTYPITVAATNNNTGSVFWHLLPYIEANDIRDQLSQGFPLTIAVYNCPSDPTLGSLLNVTVTF